MDERTSAIAAQIQDLYEQVRARITQLRSDLQDAEGTAEGLRRALLALGVEVEGVKRELTGDRLRAEIYKVLESADPAHGGLHYQDIVRQVADRGWVIRGRDPAANALAHMSQSPLFRPLGHGIYTWVPRDEGVDAREADDAQGPLRTAEVRDDWSPTAGKHPGPGSPVLTLADLVVGAVYRRRADLHAAGLGGDNMKGISYPAGGDHVLLFSDPSSESLYGYRDGWEDGGIYRYFGEWRGAGEMTMTAGNAAIRDLSPELYLFTKAGDGHRFEGRFRYGSHRLESAIREGELRRAIVFRLAPTAQTVVVTEPALLITINQLYRPDMTAEELYEATRGIWVLGERRDRAELALAVYQGVVREVYRILAWHPSGTLAYRTRDASGFRDEHRWEFEGEVAADVRDKYVGQSVGPGGQNPVRYVNL